MPKPKLLPSAERLRECFDYDLETGVLTWQVRPREHFDATRGWRSFNANFAGKRAGTITKTGHRNVYINAVRYSVSRVVIKWMTGEEPPKTVDHCGGDPANDKWENLRPATMLEQGWNRRLRKDNTSGFRGVRRDGKGWMARINEGGVRRYLGTYDTPEEAAAAYEAEAPRIRGEFYRKLGYVDALVSLTPKRRAPRVGVSGLRGVYRRPNAWVAQISRDGRQVYLGFFKTREKAHVAYRNALRTSSSE